MLSVFFSFFFPQEVHPTACLKIDTIVKCTKTAKVNTGKLNLVRLEIRMRMKKAGVIYARQCVALMIKSFKATEFLQSILDTRTTLFDKYAGICLLPVLESLATNNSRVAAFICLYWKILQDPSRPESNFEGWLNYSK